MAVRVIVVHPHRSFTDGLVGLLAASTDLEVVDVVQSASRALTSIERLRPDVVLLDIDVVTDALGVVSRGREQDSKVRFVAMTRSSQLATAIAAVRAGASGLVTHDSPLSCLVSTIAGVGAGESHIPPELLTGVLQVLQGKASAGDDVDARLGRLSGREREVLELMVDGLAKPQISDLLFISSNTVRTHIKNILAKLEVHSSLQAVSLGLRGGMRPRRTEGTGE